MPATPPSAPLGPSVLRMAAPLVVSFWMRAAFTLVDTAYAATIGDAAVAAVGLTVPFEFLMIAVWVGLSTGLTSRLSRAIGEGADRRVQQYVRAAHRMILVAAPVFAALGAALWFAAPRMGLSAEVYHDFRVYGSVLVGGSALTAFWSVIPDSMVKAHQDTRSTMWAGILSNVLNLALNTLFLFAFHWGVFGIALSTVLGRLAGLAYAGARARAHERRRRASLATSPAACEPDPRPGRSLLALAVPSSLTFALMAAEAGVINLLLARGTDATEAIAAYSIYHRVTLFALNPVIAVSVALLPYVARRYGSGDLEGIRRGLRQAMLAVVAYSILVLAPALAAGAPWIARALAESPVTAAYAVFALFLVPVACLASAPFLLARPIFEGMSRGNPGLAAAVVRYAVLTAPAAWGGMRVAPLFGAPAFHGMVLALILVAAVTSVGFWMWLRAALARIVPAGGALAPPP